MKIEKHLEKPNKAIKRKWKSSRRQEL